MVCKKASTGEESHPPCIMRAPLTLALLQNHARRAPKLLVGPLPVGRKFETQHQLAGASGGVGAYLLVLSREERNVIPL